MNILENEIKDLPEQSLYTSLFPISLEEATKLANRWTKGLGSFCDTRWKPCYNTAIRLPKDKLLPSEIKQGREWVVTNRFAVEHREKFLTTFRK